MRHLVALGLALLPLAAHAQPANPAPIPTDAPGIVIPGSTSYRAVRYQVQGVGFACVSWGFPSAGYATAMAISGNSTAATCTGRASFLVTAGSTDGRGIPGIVNASPLFAIGAPGSSLQISYEIQ